MIRNTGTPPVFFIADNVLHRFGEKGNHMTSKVNFVNIPQELKTNASFCVWKLEKRNGKPTKVPYNPRTGALARTNDASTFSDFPAAMKAYASVSCASI